MNSKLDSGHGGDGVGYGVVFVWIGLSLVEGGVGCSPWCGMVSGWLDALLFSSYAILACIALCGLVMYSLVICASWWWIAVMVSWLCGGGAVGVGSGRVAFPISVSYWPP